DGPGEGGLEHRLVQGGRVAVIDHRSFWIDEYNVRDGRGANRGREPSFRIDGGGEFDFWLCERANVPLRISGYGNDLELAFIFLLPAIELRNPFAGGGAFRAPKADEDELAFEVGLITQPLFSVDF